MNLPKFKDFLANTIAASVYGYKDTLTSGSYVTDLEFQLAQTTERKDILSLTSEEQRAYTSGYYNLTAKVRDFEKAPVEQDFLALDLMVTLKIHGGGSFNNGGVSLKSLNALAQKMHTQNITINGDGHDFSYSEYTSDHASEIIINVIFENKEKLLEDYKSWYVDYKNFQQQKSEQKAAKKLDKKLK